MISSRRRIVYLAQSLERATPMWSSTPSDPPPQAREIEQCMKMLDSVQREIVERRFWLGHSIAQIGRSFEMSAEWTRRELHSALLQLRRRLTLDPEVVRSRHCKLCTHAERRSIDELLRTGQREGSWRGYLKLLRARFGITGLPAKALESHLNNHTPLQEDLHDHAGTGPRQAQHQPLRIRTAQITDCRFGQTPSPDGV